MSDVINVDRLKQVFAGASLEMEFDDYVVSLNEGRSIHESIETAFRSCLKHDGGASDQEVSLIVYYLQGRAQKGSLESAFDELGFHFLARGF